MCGRVTYKGALNNQIRFNHSRSTRQKTYKYIMIPHNRYLEVRTVPVRFIPSTVYPAYAYAAFGRHYRIYQQYSTRLNNTKMYYFAWYILQSSLRRSYRIEHLGDCVCVCVYPSVHLLVCAAHSLLGLRTSCTKKPLNALAYIPIKIFKYNIKRYCNKKKKA